MSVDTNLRRKPLFCLQNCFFKKSGESQTQGLGLKDERLKQHREVKVFFFSFSKVQMNHLMHEQGTTLSGIKANLILKRVKTGNLQIKVSLIP